MTGHERTATLRERLHEAAEAGYMGTDTFDGRYWEAIGDAVANALLDEIAARCAARGYDDLVGWFDDEHGAMVTESIVDFLAELRGELE